VIANWRERKCYVGSSKYMEDRLKGHLSHFQRGKHHSKRLQADWDRLGPSAFQFLRWETVENLELLNERERFWIEKFEGHKNYNTAVPGDRVFKPSLSVSGLKTKAGWLREGDKVFYKGKHRIIKSFCINRSRCSVGKVIVFFHFTNQSVGGKLKRLIETPEKFFGRRK